MSDTIYWTMKDGTKISVDDMDINHLRNTLKMLIRRAEERQARLNRIAKRAQEVGRMIREEITDCQDLEQLPDNELWIDL